MSIALILPFENILRSVAEHGPEISSWLVGIAAAILILIGWSSVAYTKLKGRKVQGLHRMVASQIGLLLVTIAVINFFSYKKLWISITGIVVAIILFPIVLKLMARQSEKDAKNRQA